MHKQQSTLKYQNSDKEGESAVLLLDDKLVEIVIAFHAILGSGVAGLGASLSLGGRVLRSSCFRHNLPVVRRLSSHLYVGTLPIFEITRFQCAITPISLQVSQSDPATSMSLLPRTAGMLPHIGDLPENSSTVHHLTHCQTAERPTRQDRGTVYLFCNSAKTADHSSGKTSCVNWC